MDKYRRIIEEEVDAVQWFNHGDHDKVRKTSYAEVHEILGTSGCSHNGEDWSVLGVLDTPVGKKVVSPGDWIVKKPRIAYPVVMDNGYFGGTYEKVSE